METGLSRSMSSVALSYLRAYRPECPRHRQPRKSYQGELAYSIRLAKQRNVEKLDLLLFQFAKAGKSSRLILSKEPGNVLLRVSYKWAIGYDWVSLGLSRI